LKFITTAYNCTAAGGMPWRTPIDRVFNQKALFYIFVGIIVGATVLTLALDFPIGKTNVRREGFFDQSGKGGFYYSVKILCLDPEKWSMNNLRRWLQQVSATQALVTSRGIYISKLVNRRMIL
jgi:hypothetical protein